MTRLLASEVRRLASRRLVFWLLLVSIALMLVIVILIAVNSDPDSVDPNDAINLGRLWLSRSAAVRLGVVERENGIATVSILSYLLVIVIAASAVGAEYRAGTVGTILTWEPRRIRLLVARLLAAAVVAMVFFLIIHVLFVAAFAVAVELRGRSGSMGSSFWPDLIAVVGRATLIAGVLAIISGAIATLGKNTAAAMGVWFGYLIAVEAILRSQVDELVPWFLTPNVASAYGWESVTQNAHTVGPGTGAVRLALYVVVFGAVAVTVFRQRDVT